MREIARGVVRLVVLVGVAALAFFVGMGIRGWLEGQRPVTVHLPQLTDVRSGVSARADSDEISVGSDPAETFRDVLQIMRSEYVERIEDESKLSAGAVRTMLYALDDPATRFWTTDQYQALLRQLDGEYRGIGAVVGVVKTKRNDVEQRRVTIIAPVPGGAAAKAGLRAGDTITEIDGRWVIAYDPRMDLNRLALRNMPDSEYRRVMREATKKLTDGISWPRALERLMNPGSQQLKLTVERPGSPQPIKVSLTPATVQVPAVEYRPLRNDIGYLHIGVFNSRTPQMIRDVLGERFNAKGLVVDLRDNAGGPDLDGQQSITQAMTASLAALGVKGRIGAVAGRTPRRFATPEAGGSGLPMVVLVNGGTANVSEVAAEACRTLAGAKLVGTPTRGDDRYQRLARLKIGAMTVSAGKWLLATGKPLPRTGLAPDLMVAGGAPGQADDPPLMRAVDMLARKRGGA